MPASTLTREEKIARYVRVDAADLLMNQLLVGLGVIEGFEEDDQRVSPWTLRDELWDPDDDDAPDAEGAGARTDALLAAAFARLATDEARESFLEQSRYFANLAEKHISEMVETSEERSDG